MSMVMVVMMLALVVMENELSCLCQVDEPHRGLIHLPLWNLKQRRGNFGQTNLVGEFDKYQSGVNKLKSGSQTNWLGHIYYNANNLIRSQSLKSDILNSHNPKMYGTQVLVPSLFTWACLFAGLALSGWQYLISSICQGFGQFNTGYSLPIFVFVTLTLYLHSYSQPYLLLCWVSGCLGKVVSLECL